MKPIFTWTAVIPAVLLSSVSLSFSLPVSAEETRKLEEIIVTSSRVPMPLRQVGTSVSKIDGEEIDNRGFIALADILRTMPAIGVNNSGGFGKPTALRIRGEEAFRTLVLVDGMDISDPTPPQSAPRIEHISSTGISSVEVLRGPQGMMYGADAGGVVSIHSRQAEDNPSAKIRIDAGRYDTERASAEFSTGLGPTDVYVSGSRAETGGFNARTDDVSLADDDGYKNTTLHSRLGWDINESMRLQAVVRDVSARNEYDGCGFPQTHHCTSDFDQRSARLSFDYSGQQMGHRFSVQNSEMESHDYADGLPSFQNDGGLTKLEYLGSAKLNDNISLVFGIDHKEEEITAEGDKTTRDQLGYYLEYQGSYVDQLYLTAGLRQDDNDDFGKHTSYRVSSAYLFPVGDSNLIKLKASAGTGFRAPSLFEISYNAGPWASPPASTIVLKEETSEGYDLGVEYYIADHTRLGAVYFDQQIEDRIDFDLAGFSGYLQSEGKSESTGVELSAEYQPVESWAVSANFTYNDAKTATGAPRIRRPKQLANARLSLFPSQGLAFHFNWRTSRNAEANDGSKLDNYNVMDMSAWYTVLPKLEFYVRVENALDEEYEEVLGYNSAGRAGYLGAEYSF